MAMFPSSKDDFQRGTRIEKRQILQKEQKECCEWDYLAMKRTFLMDGDRAV